MDEQFYSNARIGAEFLRWGRKTASLSASLKAMSVDDRALSVLCYIAGTLGNGEDLRLAIQFMAGQARRRREELYEESRGASYRHLRAWCEDDRAPIPGILWGAAIRQVHRHAAFYADRAVGGEWVPQKNVFAYSSFGLWALTGRHPATRAQKKAWDKWQKETKALRARLKRERAKAEK